MTSVGKETGGLAGDGVAPMNSNGYDASTFAIAVATACGIWYFAVLLVQAIGFMQLYRYYSSKPAPACSPKLPTNEVPHVTILRPMKGLEPQLYECLSATFRQTYPQEKLTVYFCVSSRSDPAYQVARRVLEDFPSFDAKLFVEEEDPNLSGNGEASNLGPNPKIRNMSRGYREAKGDILWIIDCNVWIAKGVAGRMVDKLCGFGTNGRPAEPYKFVHQLPLVVDTVEFSASQDTQVVVNGNLEKDQHVSLSNRGFPQLSMQTQHETLDNHIIRSGGGRLEEMFMASSHAKFYTAINTVCISPCIVGKSTMFRRSHLNYLTLGSSPYSPGIDYFSDNICEDHLIGDLLWRKNVPEEEKGERWGKHALVFGDLAIQPIVGMSIRDYVARRVRWLRVRKWTVMIATLVEPGVESLLCSTYGSFALTTLPWFHETLGIPHTWTAFALIWLTNILGWITIDWFVYRKLHSADSVEQDKDTPEFARPLETPSRRPFPQWMMAWLGRELLALPVWTWAVLGGMTVVWRSKKFWVGMDMKVHEIKTPETVPKSENGWSKRKYRQE